MLYLYDKWLDDNLNALKRIREKLMTLPVEAVIEAEYGLVAYQVLAMIYNVLDIKIPPYGTGNDEYSIYMENVRKNWLANES